MTDKLQGLLAGVFAFSFWGLAPIFWKQLDHAPALELLCHRVFWGFITLFFIQFFSGKINSLVHSLMKKENLKPLFGSALVIGLNWFTFTYAIVENQIIQASFGYFINPLMNVVIGVLFLDERLSLMRKIAVAFAIVGVGIMFYGKIEGVWISLVLATTFSMYGLIRKQIIISAENGLLFELFLLFGPILILMSMKTWSGEFIFLNVSFLEQILFMACGAVTIIPLFFFVFSAKRLLFSEVGMVQYIAPSLQLLTGIYLYQEPFSIVQLIAFSFIWIGILVFLYRDIINLFTKKVMRAS